MKNTLLSIQGLRAVAASCVVVSHSIYTLFHRDLAMNSKYIDFANAIGWTGVCVFFAISGFIMVYNSFYSFGSKDAAMDFFCRRIIRIFPLYFIATILQFINKFHFSIHYSFTNLVYSLLFIPYIGQDALYRPILGQGWTLNLEMFFYLVFAISLCMERRNGFILSMGVLTGLGFVDIAGWNEISFYTQRILFYFVVGIMVGIIYRSYNPKGVVDELTALGVSIFLLSIVIILHTIGNITLALITGILTAGVSVYLCATATQGSTNLVALILNNLGNASYSVYLFHGFFLGVTKRFMLDIFITGYTLLFIYIIIAVIIENAIGFLIYKHLELPITKMVKRAYARLSKAKNLAM